MRTKKTVSKKGGLLLHRSAKGEARIGRKFEGKFRVSAKYLEEMPDIMDAVGEIEGAEVAIQQVGVSGFKMPLKFRYGNGKVVELPVTVSGAVSLGAELKGINMGRIMRVFYEYADLVFSPEALEGVLKGMLRKLGGSGARLSLRFEYPVLQESLRSGLRGWQFYGVEFFGVLEGGVFRRFVELGFEYSSACPCSAELAEHAREKRGVYAVAHSQRSRATVRVEVAKGKKISVEDLRKHCAEALKTETQVMVKREDEQAFAELNGSYLKLVEDAARLIFERLDADKRIRDFRVSCRHLESLHSHDAVSVICKGVRGGFGSFAGEGF